MGGHLLHAGIIAGGTREGSAQTRPVLSQGLRILTEKYGKDGFQVIAFSCNQFGGQAPGTSEEERAFAIKKFGIESLPVMVRPACALATLVAGCTPG